MKKTFVTAALVALLAFSASALDLQTARSQGLVGEKTDGFVEALNPSASALAAEVNARRLEEYQRISKENGQPVKVVGTLAAGQIISKLGAGSMYQDTSGAWKKR